MRPAEEVDRVLTLANDGLNHCEIARATGIPRSTLRGWLQNGQRKPRRAVTVDLSRLPPREYAYLLGVYLGDGTISRHRKGVYSLRVFQDGRYPGIVLEIAAAMRAVMPQNRVGIKEQYRGWNMTVISSTSKTWPLVFPQAGPGMKHTRKIELSAWQWGYVWQEPGMFVRGLIHSDGCRVMNQVIQRKYAYPRYFFSNESADIQQLFRDACDLIGVEYRNNRRNSISVAKRASVAILDEIVGPKR